MALGAIPLTEILAYMQMFNVEEEEERRQLLRYIHVLDRVFLEHARIKEQSKEPTKEQKRGGGRR